MIRKNHILWKLTTVVIMAGMCLGAVSGCGSGAAPQKDVVSFKEQSGEHGEQAAASQTADAAAVANIAEQVQAPERYQMQAAGEAVTITADAEIIIPDVPGIKLKKVTARTFTQEDYDAVINVLLGGGQLWEADIEAMQFVTVNGQDYYLGLDNNATAVSHRVEFLVERQDGNGSYLSFSNSLPDWDNLPEYMGEIQLQQGFVNMETPPEEIMSEIMEIMNQMGVGEYDIQGGGYFACWIADEDAMDNAAYLASTYLAGLGYGVHLCRVEDGIPITYTYEDGGSITGDDALAWAQSYEKKEDFVPEVIYWPYEEMTFIYTDDGLRTFEWQNPYTIEDMSEEYVFLLPFSDISDIFEELILKKQADSFNNEGDTVDIQVDKVVLSYMRIRKKNALEGTLVPVWDFFGTKTYKNAAGETELVVDRVYDGVLPESLMTINAMDGTIIERAAGY